MHLNYELSEFLDNNTFVIRYYDKYEQIRLEYPYELGSYCHNWYNESNPTDPECIGDNPAEKCSA